VAGAPTSTRATRSTCPEPIIGVDPLDEVRPGRTALTVARSPGWRFELTPAARWVAAHGLSTRLAPPSRPLDDREWADLVRHVRAHRLEGLLVDAVASGSLPVTDAQGEVAAELEIELTRARMWHERRLREVVELVEAGGFEVRALKGLALAHLDYPDPQFRPTGDVDLLVHGADLDPLDQLIRATGAVRVDPDPRPGYSALAGKGATYATAQGEIDLHRLLVWGPFGVRLDPELLWSERRGFTVDGRRFDTIGLTDTLLHACCHLLVLGDRRALQGRDVAQLLASPELDPDEVLRRARHWGAEALLATAIVLTEEELGLTGADDLRNWAQGFEPTWRDQLWLRVERPHDPLAGLELAAALVELPDRLARRALIDAVLRPEAGTWPRPLARASNLARRLADR
jgi:hypothetical protein